MSELNKSKISKNKENLLYSSDFENENDPIKNKNDFNITKQYDSKYYFSKEIEQDACLSIPDFESYFNKDFQQKNSPCNFSGIQNDNKNISQQDCKIASLNSIQISQIQDQKNYFYNQGLSDSVQKTEQNPKTQQQETSQFEYLEKNFYQSFVDIICSLVVFFQEKIFKNEIKKLFQTNLYAIHQILQCDTGNDITIFQNENELEQFVSMQITFMEKTNMRKYFFYSTISKKLNLFIQLFNSIIPCFYGYQTQKQDNFNVESFQIKSFIKSKSAELNSFGQFIQKQLQRLQIGNLYKIKKFIMFKNLLLHNKNLKFKKTNAYSDIIQIF